MPFGMMSPLLAASDFWMAKWLTPFWFVGAGIVIGFAALAAFLLIFSLLMVPMKGLEKQRKDGTLHYIAAGITLLLGAGIGYFLRSGEIGQAFLVKGEFATEEWLLVSFAATAMTGVIVWALLFCSSSRFFGELRSLLFEGVGFAMIIVLAAVAAIGLAATPWIEKPAEAIASIPQFFSPQSTFKEYTIAGAKTPEDRKLTKIEVQYDPATLGVVRIESNRRVILADASEIEKLKFAAVTIDADAPKLWERSMGPTKCPLPLVGGAEVYVQNEEIDDATLTISIQSYPTVPQSLSILLTAIFVTVFGLLFFLMQGAGFLLPS